MSQTIVMSDLEGRARRKFRWRHESDSYWNVDIVFERNVWEFIASDPPFDTGIIVICNHAQASQFVDEAYVGEPRRYFGIGWSLWCWLTPEEEEQFAEYLE